jgi:hypothetical protein
MPRRGIKDAGFLNDELQVMRDILAKQDGR